MAKDDRDARDHMEERMEEINKIEDEEERNKQI